MPINFFKKKKRYLVRILTWDGSSVVFDRTNDNFKGIPAKVFRHDNRALKEIFEDCEFENIDSFVPQFGSGFSLVLDSSCLPQFEIAFNEKGIDRAKQERPSRPVPLRRYLFNVKKWDGSIGEVIDHETWDVTDFQTFFKTFRGTPEELVREMVFNDLTGSLPKWGTGYEIARMESGVCRFQIRPTEEGRARMLLEEKLEPGERFLAIVKNWDGSWCQVFDKETGLTYMSPDPIFKALGMPLEEIAKIMRIWDTVGSVPEFGEKFELFYYPYDGWQVRLKKNEKGEKRYHEKMRKIEEEQMLLFGASGSGI